MSKKKKVAPAKAAKKNPVKKPAKKASKPSPKKSTKKIVVKKSAKPAAKPKAAAKKPVKKAKALNKSKKVTPKAKAPVKKPTVKKVEKKAAPKKIVSKAKPAPKKTAPAKKAAPKAAPKKAPAKKAVVSKTSPKPVAAPAKKAPIPSKPEKAKVTAAAKAPEPKAVAKPVPEEKPKKVEEVVTKKQLAERRANDVLAITNTIPVKVKSEISPSKIASISNSITNPIKHPDSYSVKAEKEPNGKFELEFVVHASAEMLYEFISTPSGLSEWFCDDLNIRNGIYTFIWEEQMQQARLLKTIELQLVRFQWVDKTDGSYFEFRIQRDELTNDISLLVTDFAETHSDRESAKLLWHSQIEKLMHVIGSIF